ncbi:MAG: aminopeptidase [Clostridia bacterium]|nr:aminopeptidase [Clostridia bacterium]
MVDIKELKNNLFCPKKNLYLKISDEEFEKTQNFAENYKKFLDFSKTERKSVEYFVKKAKKNGFEEFDLDKKYNPGDRIFRINRGKSVVFAIIGKNNSREGFNIAVSHIDSPRIDLKPNPIYENNEMVFFKTHYYGGIKKYQWTAIPLALYGKIILKNQDSIEISIGENESEPCFYISDLLPHLAREQMSKSMSKAIEGESLNILIGSLPFKSDTGSELVKLNILKILNEKYGIIERDLSFAELELVPAFKSRDIGFDRSLIGGYGHDDRCCAFPAFEAILNTKNPEKTCVVMLADKEEIGSDGNTGMKSSFFRYFLADLASIDGIKTRHALSKSRALSADVDAAFDPNYSSSFDSINSSFINRGVVITKYTGSGGKAGASDASAEFIGYVRKIFEDNNVNYQLGELGKVDTGGGGTVAKYIANLNIDVVDVGIPVLSMHSPFEVISKLDLYEMFKAVRAFFG